MSWGETRRVDTPDGFMFLTPPWWFIQLHLFGKKRQRGFASLAYCAYWMLHDRNHLPFRLTRRFTRIMAHLLVHYYPIYWLIVSLRTLGKRLLGVALILAILGIPFLLGFLFGAVHHINISIR